MIKALIIPHNAIRYNLFGEKLADTRSIPASARLPPLWWWDEEPNGVPGLGR